VARQFDNRHVAGALREGMAAVPAQMPDGPPPDRELVVKWLRNLRILTGVPFHYLVPDGAMLPAESIRFFVVDQGWIDCLLDGAYSVGSGPAATAAARAAQPDAMAAAHERAAGLRAELVGTEPEPLSLIPVASGFLLRSSLVSGWPGIEITAHGGGKELTVLRLEHVSPAVLLGLYAGHIEQLDLREPSEGLHFGVDESQGSLTKDIRYANGDDQTPIGSFTGRSTAVPLRGTGDTRVVELSSLAATIRPSAWTASVSANPPAFTAAEFALEMVEGAGAATFTVEAP
jgi:hypothetical protein